LYANHFLEETTSKYYRMTRAWIGSEQFDFHIQDDKSTPEYDLNLLGTNVIYRGKLTVNRPQNILTLELPGLTV